MNKLELVSKLKLEGVLKSPRIEKALLEIDRADFVRPEDKEYSYADTAMSIGHGQTISQPFTVVFMLELLDVGPDQKILDVGTGSGWQAALLAYLAGEEGSVHTVEIVPDLVKFAKQNILKFLEISGRITFHEGSAREGVAKEAPFDRIIAAAEVRNVPEAWSRQLKIGGIMVFPKDNGIYRVIKSSETDFDTLYYPGFVFVPFVED